jgi:carbamoyl-phosphate synthase small subunit
MHQPSGPRAKKMRVPARRYRNPHPKAGWTGQTVTSARPETHSLYNCYRADAHRDLIVIGNINMTQPAKLALEDGAVFLGTAFGAIGEVDGEVCFNTSMTGYQEILTDPSYRGQIVTMTYPEIGNYGVNGEDVESHKPHLAGFIVRQRSRRASNFRADEELDHYLQRYGIVALEGIDTRALVRRLRSQGAMKGVLSSVDLDDARLVAKARSSPGLVGRDLVREVIPEGTVEWHQALSPWARKLLTRRLLSRTMKPARCGL